MFYHISSLDHGQSFKFQPRVPKSSVISKEGNIPRVCVAPTVYYCLCSLAGCRPLKFSDIIFEFQTDEGTLVSPSVYRTQQIPFIPPDASDFRKNKEGWFLKPITMERIGYLDLRSLSIGKIDLITKSKDFILDVKLKTIIKYQCKKL